MLPAPMLLLRCARQRVLPARRRLLLAWLALALLQAQGLGLWHRVAHGGLHGSGAPTVAADLGTTGLDHGAAALFGHDADDEPGCRLFDQLVAAEALLVAPLAVLLQDVPGDEAGALPTGRPGWPARYCQARAPPRG